MNNSTLKQRLDAATALLEEAVELLTCTHDIQNHYCARCDKIVDRNSEWKIAAGQFLQFEQHRAQSDE